MKTMLVPVDFTATTENAVNFAAEWSREYDYKRIILFKTFYDSMYENLIMSAEYCNVNEDYLNRQRQQATEQLHDLCSDLADKTPVDVKVTTAISEEPLLRGMMEVIQNEKPDLIILGSNNYNNSDDSFISNNVIAIAKISPARVLIVPADYTYKPVEKALLPYNLDTIKDLDKLESLRSSRPWGDIKLLVLNVNTDTRLNGVPEKLKETEGIIKNLLKNFQHEMYYVTDRNIINGIKNFIKEHDVELIMALPGKHSFLYEVTHQSISEAIYRNARQPVLILK